MSPLPLRPDRATASSAARTRAFGHHRPPPLLLSPRVAATASPNAPTTETPPSQITNLSVRVAQTAAELRAAAYLRAAAFGTYPPGRSEFAARSHRRMKGDSEWEAVTAKVQGKEPAYAQLRVACLIATAPVPSPHAARAAVEGTTTTATNAALAARLAADLELDPSASLLPADNAASATIEAVIGTLDVNVGAVLPAEELIGKRGRVGVAAAAAAVGSTDPSPPPSTRAYLSNVCVAKAARGLGVGKQLLRAAEELVVRPADEGGLLAVPLPPLAEDASDADENDANDDNSSFHLYVHVVHDNAAARALYEGGGGGFRVEAEETEAFARGLARPRRLLLHKRLRLPLSALPSSG